LVLAYGSPSAGSSWSRTRTLDGHIFAAHADDYRVRTAATAGTSDKEIDVNDSQGSTDGGLRDQAVAAVKRKHAFKQMLASYVIVNAFLIVIWAVSGAGYFWPVWVLGGWGLGVAFTAYKAYGPREAITDDEVAHEMTRLRGT
jgi:hypothetical protein